MKFQLRPEEPFGAINSWNIRNQNDSLCYASITTASIANTSENDASKGTVHKVFWKLHLCTYMYEFFRIIRKASF